MSSDTKIEAEPLKHTAKPIGAATQRWMERRLGQKRLPLDEMECVRERTADHVANDNAGAKS